MNQDDEFKVLVLGALNWLLADAIAKRPGGESEGYYYDWLERQRKLMLELVNQAALHGSETHTDATH